MRYRIVMLIALLATASLATAQQPGPATGAPSGPPGPHRPPAANPGGGDPFADNFYPPELVMQFQRAIDLKPEQRETIKAEMQKSMARFADLQWQQSEASEALQELARQPRVDEQQLAANLDKLLGVETEIKKLHVGMLVKVKNTLTSEQQKQLQELKRQQAPRPQGPMGRPGMGGGPRGPGGPGGPGERGATPAPPPPAE